MSNEPLTLTQYAKARVGETLRTWLGNWPMSEFPQVFGTGPTTTGMQVSETTALNYSAVWAAVSVVSADIASLPLILYKRTANGGKERYTDSRLYELLHDAPNPEMGSMVFREALQAHVMLWGNAYAEIQRDDLGRPVALWPLTPDRVTPFREDVNGALRYRVTNLRGAQSILQPRNMLHVPGLGFDGVSGYSVIQKARESIGLGLATEAFGGTFFGNGSTFGGVLSFKQERLTPEFKQGVRESVGAIHTGVERAHKFLVLGGEAKYEKLGIPPNDAQFLETRRFQVNEIARWFRIPPHKLGDLERATFSNIEQQDLEYYRGGLRHWLVRWEQEYTRKLIAPLERRQQFVKHNAEGFLRGDSVARAAFYQSMFMNGSYSINMILESEDQNTIGPEGDVHFVPANLTPATFAMEGPPAPAAPAAPGAPAPGQPAPADNPADDTQQQNALHDLLTQIAANTSALQTSMETERESWSLAEQEQHRQLVAQLEAERVELQQQFDEYRESHASALDTAEHATDEARAAADTAKGAAITLAAEVRIATDGAAKAEHRANQETEARAAAEAALALERQAEQQRLTGMIAAHRALLVDAMQRILAPETDRARKHQATPEKLRVWLESFYVTYEDKCLETLRPAIRAHLTWKQSAEDVDAVTLTLVREHIAESQRQLTAIVNGEPDEMHGNLERMLTRWEQDRPNALADRILREEVDHVRSRR